jgi:drug/metabolite transporter (DMT)-like permease
MNRKICFVLMALPVYLYNVGLSNAPSSDVTIVKGQFPTIVALIAYSYSTNAHSRILPWQISARDDQTEDCLRAGTCKD